MLFKLISIYVRSIVDLHPIHCTQGPLWHYLHEGLPLLSNSSKYHYHSSLYEWKKLHMKDFLAMTLGFMDGLEQPESKTRVETYQSFMQQLEQPASETKVEV
jgi:hypothetical protein